MCFTYRPLTPGVMLRDGAVFNKKLEENHMLRILVISLSRVFIGTLIIRSDNEEITRALRKLEGSLPCSHCSLPVPILSLMNSIHTIQSYFPQVRVVIIFPSTSRFFGSWDSSVSIVSEYGQDDWAIGFRSPAETKHFSSDLCPDRLWGPTSLLYKGYRRSFPGGKARQGRDADHSPPSSVEVKSEKELYLLSPQAPPWRVVGLF
jgi:hypothetical protein